jgi:hypothetical protein
VGEEVKAKNEKWWTRAYARTREKLHLRRGAAERKALSQGSIPGDFDAVRSTHVPATA